MPVAGGRTKHKGKTNKKRTVKAASTYGEAYRKYVKMYGGQGKDENPEKTEPTKPQPTEENQKEEEKGFFGNLVETFQTITGKKNEETKNEETKNDIFEKAKDSLSSVTSTVQEKVQGAEESLESTKNTLGAAVDKVSETAEQVKGTLSETTSKLGDTISQGVQQVEEVTSPVTEKDVAESGAAEAAAAAATETVTAAATEETQANNTPSSESSNSSDSSSDSSDGLEQKNEAVTALAGEAVGSSMSAAEQALQSMKDAQKPVSLQTRLLATAAHHPVKH
jgi:hypothetical protein